MEEAAEEIEAALGPIDVWVNNAMVTIYRERDWPAAKAVALLRNQFGGHPLQRTEEDPVHTLHGPDEEG